MSRSAVIVDYARTPFGRLMGGLSSHTAPELGATVIAELIERNPGLVERLEHVIMGNVLQAGVGQIPSRQATIGAGLDKHITSETINKVCASGFRAVTLADSLIRAGDYSVIIAGGMESMSNAPHIAKGVRGGVKMGSVELVDAMLHDGLTDPFNGNHMVVNTSAMNDELGISREDQDAWAARSHVRAIASTAIFAEEIVAVTTSTRKGDVVTSVDEGPRADSTLEKLASLKPAMTKDGTVTAGNAPGVNDGAAALAVMDSDTASVVGCDVLATIRGHLSIAGRSDGLPQMPGGAINVLLERAGLTIDQIDRIEINEAFASVALHSIDMVGADPERVNVHGGAVALGHPIGASGTRIIGTLARELKRSGGGLGIAAICSGGGQGDAILLEI